MNRKSFLKTVPIVGATGGLALAGCSTGTGTEEESISGDLAILTQAAEREAIVIQTYKVAEGIIETQEVLNTAAYYRSHHEEHLDLFNELIAGFNGIPVLIDDVSVDSRINQATDEESALRLAMTLELEAAQAYFQDTVTNLVSNNAKILMGDIYPVELSHFVTLNAVLDASPAISGATLSEINSEFNGIN
ncbi:MAG: hypothetical protein BalsKO_14530 [Balneolaceae bacterium]